MKLHEKLAALRKRAGLSQMELAERMETTRQAVSKWETGTALPSTENLRSLCRHYHVTMDFMVDEGRDLTELDSAPMQEPARPQGGEGLTGEEEQEGGKDEEAEGTAPRKRQRRRLAAAIIMALAVGAAVGFFLGRACPPAGGPEGRTQGERPEKLELSADIANSQGTYTTGEFICADGNGDLLRIIYRDESGNEVKVILQKKGFFGDYTDVAAMRVAANNSEELSCSNAAGKSFRVIVQSTNGGPVRGNLRRIHQEEF